MIRDCLCRPLPVLLAALCAVLTAVRCSRDQPTMRVTGIVTDSVTGRPIAGATVSDDGYGPSPCRKGVTDSSGWYQYYTWPEEHNIIARAAGYRPRRMTLTTNVLNSDTVKHVSLRLAPE